jgi:tight adherence protein C
MWFVIIGIAVILIVAVALIYIGIRNPQAMHSDADLQSRLDELIQKGEEVNLEKIEMSQPFTERVIYPLARTFGEFAMRFTPERARANISRKLELAGTSAKLTPTVFITMQFGGLAFFAALSYLSFPLGKPSAVWPHFAGCAGIWRIGLFLPAIMAFEPD